MATQQSPIHSGFGAATTAAEVIRGMNLQGKTAIVTGGYSGIGLETARQLVKAGAKVIVPARSHERAVQALHVLPAELPARPQRELLAAEGADQRAAIRRLHR